MRTHVVGRVQCRTRVVEERIPAIDEVRLIEVVCAAARRGTDRSKVHHRHAEFVVGSQRVRFDQGKIAEFIRCFVAHDVHVHRQAVVVIGDCGRVRRGIEGTLLDGVDLVAD